MEQELITEKIEKTTVSDKQIINKLNLESENKNLISNEWAIWSFFLILESITKNLTEAMMA